MSGRHVLVVDDEARIREVVEYALRRDGYQVSLARDGNEALSVAKAGAPDLIVLDVMLPEMDGLEVCRRLRAFSRCPVLFLSARSEEIDRVVGLEIGGDDYLTKPFSPRELVARVRAVLRRGQGAPPEATVPAAEEASSTRGARPSNVEHGGVRVDFERHEATYVGAVVDLTPTELAVLAALLERPGIVLSRAQLMERGNSDATVVTERTIDTHVRRIRRKFRAHGHDPITTVHGVGYKASND